MKINSYEKYRLDVKRYSRELARQEYNGDFWLVDKLVKGEFQ